MQSARYVRLFADSRGETHFEDLKVLLAPQEYPPAPNPLNIAQFLPVTGSYWLGAPGDWPGQDAHQAPQRQIFCTVEGEYEITVSDGDVRCFPAGSILLFDDTSGDGYQMRVTNDRGAVVFAVAVADEKKRNNAV